MKIKFLAEKFHHKHLLKHETKQHVLIKFSLVFLVVVGYFIFISREYGIQQGFLVTGLSWSFFVLCTPVADAGFLIDFPLRLITSLRMFITEIFVWILAIMFTLYAFLFNPEIYSKTKILILFKHILSEPFPFWIIIIISMIGTFVSIQFGDELLDKVNHRDRDMYHKHKYNHKFLIMFFLFVMSFILYDFLLKELGVNLPI